MEPRERAEGIPKVRWEVPGSVKGISGEALSPDQLTALGEEGQTYSDIRECQPHRGPQANQSIDLFQLRKALEVFRYQITEIKTRKWGLLIWLHPKNGSGVLAWVDCGWQN